MIPRSFETAVILIFLMLLSSCDPNMTFDQYQKTEKGMWGYNDVKQYDVEITDSIQAYNLLLNIRHTTDYPSSNLFVFITMNGPHNVSRKDTLEVFITNKRGKWLGYGFGKIKHISRMYKNNVRFPYPGNYTFTVQQAVREPEVPVTDVGFRVEKFRYLK